MTGKITVVDGGQSIPTTDQVTKEAQSQFDALVQKIQPAATSMKAGSLPPLFPVAKPNEIIAGGGTMEIQNASINEFGPAAASVPVGGSLSWDVVGAHTISFNTPVSAQGFIAKAPDGAVHLNAQAAAPVGGPGVPPPSGPPSGPPPNGPPPPPTVVDGGVFDGTAPHSSGIVLSFPPSLSAYKLKFTKAGSYNYVCLIHPDMKGTVKVG
jgi:plastocyanin